MAYLLRSRFERLSRGYPCAAATARGHFLPDVFSTLLYPVLFYASGLVHVCVATDSNRRAVLRQRTTARTHVVYFSR